MPINAPPEFYEIKKKVLEAKDPYEKLKWLNELLKVAPKHKGAHNLLIQIKKAIKKLREELEEKERKKGTTFNPYAIKKEGDATIVILGVENSGKSWLLNRLTNANVEESDIPFTTDLPKIGALHLNGAIIQTIELPAFFESRAYTLIRNADLILILLDASRDLEEQYQKIMKYLEQGGIEINKRKPNIKFERKYSGGIKIYGEQFITDASKEDVIKALQEFGIYNAEITIYEKVTFEDVLDAIDGSKAYKKAIFVFNKVKNEKEIEEFIKKHKINKYIIIKDEKDVEKLKEKIWKELELIRVYTMDHLKKKAERPLILKKGSKVRDAVKKINEKWLDLFVYAKIKRNGKIIRVGLDYELQDGDLLEIKIK